MTNNDALATAVAEAAQAAPIPTPVAPVVDDPNAAVLAEIARLKAENENIRLKAELDALKAAKPAPAAPKPAAKLTPEQEIAALKAELAALKNRKPTLKVSPKGAVQINGLGQWPVTLYKSQMLRLLDMSKEIKDFIAKYERQDFKGVATAEDKTKFEYVARISTK